MILSPPLIFGVYVGTAEDGYDFSVSKVFTSLVIIALLSSPLVHLFQVLPGLGAAHGCFQRLHEFLLLEEKTDYRETMSAEKPGGEDHESPIERENIISLRGVSLSWNANDTPILTDLNLDVKKGTKVAIVGSVGAGKSLLLKGLIGEAYKPHGRLTLAPSTSFAYCSQNPWLENVSAQQNLTQYGNESSESDFYEQLAADCMLDDIVQLSTFTSGSIGSNGVMLSGGQRQRLVSILALQCKSFPCSVLMFLSIQALARALSTQSDTLILDDVFSALDRNTRWNIARMLFKRTPVKSNRTIIYTTHDGKISFIIT